MHVNCFEYVKLMIWWDSWILSYVWEHVDWEVFYVMHELVKVHEKAWDEMSCMCNNMWWLKFVKKHEMRWVACGMHERWMLSPGVGASQVEQV